MRRRIKCNTNVFSFSSAASRAAVGQECRILTVYRVTGEPEPCCAQARATYSGVYRRRALEARTLLKARFQTAPTERFAPGRRALEARTLLKARFQTAPTERFAPGRRALEARTLLKARFQTAPTERFAISFFMSSLYPSAAEAPPIP